MTTVKIKRLVPDRGFGFIKTGDGQEFSNRIRSTDQELVEARPISLDSPGDLSAQGVQLGISRAPLPPGGLNCAD